jgi:peptide/nickel transport system substrate-binding protein
MHRRLWIAFCAALVGAVLAVGASAEAGTKAAAPTPKSGGTMIFGAEQFPDEGLNGALACCNLFWDNVIANPVMRGAFQVQPDFTYKPMVVSGADLKFKPFRVIYHIRKEAVWNDGGKAVPITAQDFIATQKAWTDPKNDLASRAGYEEITGSKVIDSKDVQFTFKRPYAGWKDIFSGPWALYPSFVLKGQDFNKLWVSDMKDPRTGKPVSSGPFVLTNYAKGSQITEVANPLWWGPHKPYLSKIVWRFISDQSTEVQQVRGGEVYAIYPQPSPAAVDLIHDNKVVYKTGAGTTWEHLDFEIGKKGAPAIRVPDIRKAIAESIDRQAVVNRLFGEITPGLPVLQNAVFVSNDKRYVKHYDKWKFNPSDAKARLQKLGCTAGGDGILTCPKGVGRLEFRFTTTNNSRRKIAFEIIQSMLKDVGIQIDYDAYPASVAFGDEHIAGHNYDLAYFAWVGTPDPTGYVEIGSCGGDENYGEYCSRKADKYLLAARTEFDPVKQASLLNQADVILSNGLPTLPMYQLPTILSYVKGKVNNLQDNPTNEGPSYNSEDWWVS